MVSRRTLDACFERFNVLNRTPFGTPNNNLNDAANLGLVRTQANARRSMRFAASLPIANPRTQTRSD